MRQTLPVRHVPTESGLADRQAGAVLAEPSPEDGDGGVSVALTLSGLVERTGVPASSIHHYRRSGLIPPPRRQAANRFVYGEEHVAALLTIRSQHGEDSQEARARIVASAIEAFKTRSYAEVSVSDIAEAAHMAKGNLYRYFASKEELLTAAIETLLEETAEKFGATLDVLSAEDGGGRTPDRSAMALGFVLADVMPILLELGARAAKGHEPSADLARRVLRTLAATAGRPLLGNDAAQDEVIQAGLRVIETGFSTVMSWAVGEDWPPDHIQAPASG
jgi:AcrR family transcriptional regulator